MDKQLYRPMFLAQMAFDFVMAFSGSVVTISVFKEIDYADLTLGLMLMSVFGTFVQWLGKERIWPTVKRNWKAIMFMEFALYALVNLGVELKLLTLIDRWYCVGILGAVTTATVYAMWNHLKEVEGNGRALEAERNYYGQFGTTSALILSFVLAKYVGHVPSVDVVLYLQVLVFVMDSGVLYYLLSKTGCMDK